MNRRIITCIDRIKLYTKEVTDALKRNDAPYGMSMAAELSEIARRLSLQFRNLIALRQPNDVPMKNLIISLSPEQFDNIAFILRDYVEIHNEAARKLGLERGYNRLAVEQNFDRPDIDSDPNLAQFLNHLRAAKYGQQQLDFWTDLGKEKENQTPIP
jgi:hypothetical protein